MTRDALKEWEQKPCSPEDIRKNSDGSEYIPIGIIETKLDNYFDWGVGSFSFRTFIVGKDLFASGSCVLNIKYDEENSRYMQGAATYKITSKDNNQDYEATVLSLCIANAAKKLGKQFGRHLNGRLETGENKLPVIQVHKEVENDEELNKFLADLNDVEFYADAQAFLERSNFKYNLKAREIVSSKPIEK